MGENRSVALPLPPRIDPSEEHYPFCIVWTPIPVLSWIFPFIGHVGICDSAGRIHDFEGPYHIGVDKMLFGNPVKYWNISRMYVPTFYRSQARTRERRRRRVDGKWRNTTPQWNAVTKHFRKTQLYNFFTNKLPRLCGLRG
ncbi:hypothetical protein TcBrA4_0016290 [Trypanosoma cruzi]|nr:hypothetical protein TcBrA4_0016290 [Trypanosoma cruzi]